ncbi:MAG TPA: FtsX-like permease family protein, partial [Terriglobia bacterium]|nr:FtsX-like permease family protein [Terriglobia bacterium]
SAGIVLPLPASYQARIKTVPGVMAVSKLNWFGGYWKEQTNFFANFAVDPDTIFAVQAASQIPPDQLEAFKRERTAAVAGKQLVERFGWKIGDRITLLGSPWGFTPEFTLRGIFEGGPSDQVYFHWDYLNEAVGRPDIVSLYWVRVEDAKSSAKVGEAIDAMFRNTDAETKSESLSAFLLSFISMLGNVRAIILMIGSAVIFAILLVVANTMAMSIRERIAEAAVMRSLGFRSGQIVRLFVSESMILSLAGAIVGVGGAKLLYDGLALSQVGQFVFADFRMRAPTLLFCFALALLIGLVASGWSAYRAARINIAEALRHTG